MRPPLLPGSTGRQLKRKAAAGFPSGCGGGGGASVGDPRFPETKTKITENPLHPKNKLGCHNQAKGYSGTYAGWVGIWVSKCQASQVPSHGPFQAPMSCPPRGARRTDSNLEDSTVEASFYGKNPPEKKPSTCTHLLTCSASSKPLNRSVVPGYKVDTLRFTNATPTGKSPGLQCTRPTLS